VPFLNRELNLGMSAKQDHEPNCRTVAIATLLAVPGFSPARAQRPRTKGGAPLLFSGAGEDSHEQG
jgi:hypothetical protein